MTCAINHNTVNRQEFTISVKHITKNINLTRFNIFQIKQQFSPIMINLCLRSTKLRARDIHILQFIQDSNITVIKNIYCFKEHVYTVQNIRHFLI